MERPGGYPEALQPPDIVDGAAIRARSIERICATSKSSPGPPSQHLVHDRGRIELVEGWIAAIARDDAHRLVAQGGIERFGVVAGARVEREQAAPQPACAPLELGHQRLG